MTTLTARLGLPSTVPFVDVDYDRDTPTFLCPFTLRHLAAADPYAATVAARLDSFMVHLRQLLTSGRPQDLDRARRLLSQFKEPRELRLGYTIHGNDGHGGAEVLGARLLHALTTDLEAFMRVGVLRRLEDVQVFVNGIGNDVVSDMVGRIALGVFVEFTLEMMTAYPQLGASSEGKARHRFREWDPAQLDWIERTAVLPMVGGRVLILTPKLWADPNPIVAKERFLDLVTATVLQERMLDADGKRPSKVEAKRMQRPFSAADINFRVASEELEAWGFDLVRRFHMVAEQTLKRRMGLTA